MKRIAGWKGRFLSYAWVTVADILGMELANDFQSTARFWIANKRHKITNIVSSAVLWSICMETKECFFFRVFRGWE